jgi:hypothetical protein
MASSFLPIVHTEKKKQLESAHYHGNRQLHFDFDATVAVNIE